jgi:phosphohistidine phosphatase
MLVYILRHGIAAPRGVKPYPNDDRPLTEEGIEKISKAAKGIIRVVDDVDVILTSPLVRAADTAKIVADALNVESKLQICHELAPGSSLQNLLAYLAKYKKLRSIMIVGHEPDLAYFVSALLGKKTPVIEFKKGSLCCIEVTTIPSRKDGTLLWHLTSKQLRLMA